MHLKACSPSGALLIEKEVCLWHLLLEKNRFVALELKNVLGGMDLFFLAVQLRMQAY